MSRFIYRVCIPRELFLLQRSQHQDMQSGGKIAKNSILVKDFSRLLVF